MWVVPTEQVPQKLTLSLASGDLPEMVGGENEPIYRQLLEANMLHDLTDAWDEWGLPAIKRGHEILNNATFNEIAIDGRIFAIPSNDDPILSTQLIYYRQDWADALGIEKPTNWQELLDMAYAFAQAYPNKFAMGAFNNPLAGNSLGWVFESFGAYPTAWLEKDGELVYGVIQPEMLDALVALQDLYKAGAINKEFVQRFFIIGIVVGSVKE
jgi:putative aldouronate transport system substrate-binding protein